MDDLTALSSSYLPVLLGADGATSFGAAFGAAQPYVLVSSVFVASVIVLVAILAWRGLRPRQCGFVMPTVHPPTVHSPTDTAKQVGLVLADTATPAGTSSHNANQGVDDVSRDAAGDGTARAGPSSSGPNPGREGGDAPRTSAIVQNATVQDATIPLGTLLEGFGDGLLVVGDDQNIETVTPTCLGILGIDADPETLRGSSLHELLARSDQTVRYADGFAAALLTTIGERSTADGAAGGTADRMAWPLKRGGTLHCDYQYVPGVGHLWRFRRPSPAQTPPTTHLQAIFENSQDAVMLFDTDATLLTLNPVARACAQVIFGHPVAANMTLAEFTGQPDGGGFGADLWLALQGQSLRAERYIDHGNGENWTDVRLDPVIAPTGEVLGAIFTGRDMTERKRAEIDEKRARDFAEALVNSLPGMFLLSDARGRLVRWNRNAQEVLGYSAAELAELSLADLYYSRSLLGTHRRRLEHHGSLHDEVPLRLRGGALLPTLCTAVALPQDGEMFQTTVLLDISRQKMVERELRNAQVAMLEQNEALEAQARALAEATRRADVANRAKSEFLSRMSHELRTPLNAVNGFAQLLRKDDLSDKQQRRVRHIYNAGKHLLALIDEVLDIAKIESGHLSLSLEPVSTSGVLGDAIALIGPSAHDRAVALWPAPGADVVVRADQQRLKQIVLNLLSNAVKYNRPGGQVWIRTTPHYGPQGQLARWCLHIIDSGPGLSPAQQARLFTPFDRLGAEQSTTEGSGLGLALSQRLAAMMGGAITVTSRPGLGSRFTLELPAAAHAAPVAEAEDDDARGQAEQWGRGRTVLYIEDNLVNLELMLHLLADQHGVRVITAMQGQLGLELARQHRPDLVLLDLHLPDLSGSAVLAQLQHDAQTRDIPVVVLSADAAADTERAALAGGARAFINKPFEIAELVPTLRALLPSA
ncbi:MAG: ATP-binding protein [Trueperaceae bacterium]|nr:ATP-binding protein [Trueperaceae bacterium]